MGFADRPHGLRCAGMVRHSAFEMDVLAAATLRMQLNAPIRE
jgi:hypothetical protein